MSSSVHSWQPTPSAGPLSTKVSGPCVSLVLSLPLSPKAPIKIPQAVQRQVKQGALKGATTATTTTGGVMVTSKKGGMTIKQGGSQSAGTIKWRCAGGTIVNTPTFVHGAKVPIQETNAPTKDSLPLQESQNGGQKYNAQNNPG